ncbi:MAG: hypothetical protein RLY93_17500 [Sumerlaeia bacterium]
MTKHFLFALLIGTAADHVIAADFHYLLEDHADPSAPVIERRGRGTASGEVLHPVERDRQARIRRTIRGFTSHFTIPCLRSKSTMPTFRFLACTLAITLYLLGCAAPNQVRLVRIGPYNLGFDKRVEELQLSDFEKEFLNENSDREYEKSNHVAVYQRISGNIIYSGTINFKELRMTEEYLREQLEAVRDEAVYSEPDESQWKNQHLYIAIFKKRVKGEIYVLIWHEPCKLLLGEVSYVHWTMDVSRSQWLLEDLDKIIPVMCPSDHVDPEDGRDAKVK